MLQGTALLEHRLVAEPRVCPDLDGEELALLFDLLDKNDSDALMDFLKAPKETSVDPLVLIVDMFRACRLAQAETASYPRRRARISSALKEVIKHTYRAMLVYYCGLPRETETEEAIKKAVWDSRDLLLETSPGLTAEQQDEVEHLLRIHRGTILAKAYYCKEAVLALFRASQTREGAQTRRDMIVQWFGDVQELREIIGLLRGKEFEQIISHL